MDPMQDLPRENVLHPVDHMQRNRAADDESYELHQQAMCYGPGFARRTATCRLMLAADNHNGMLRTSNLLADAYSDKLSTVEFDDVFLRGPKKPVRMNRVGEE